MLLLIIVTMLCLSKKIKCLSVIVEAVDVSTHHFCNGCLVVVLSDILLRRGFYWGIYCCMSYFNIWVITVWRYTDANFRWGRKNHEGLMGIFLFDILAGGAYFCCLIHQDTWSSNLYIHHHHNNYHRSIYQI